MQLHTIQIESPLGPVGVVAGDDGVYAVQLRPNDPGEEAWLRHAFPHARFVPEPNRVAAEAAAELIAYFEGKRRELLTPVVLCGTPFQNRVWEAVRRIPYGEVATYGEIAAELRSGPRAVGGAIGRNALSIYVPCHRVVSAAGLGGYGGQEQLKRRLLRLEGNRLF